VVGVNYSMSVVNHCVVRGVQKCKSHVGHQPPSPPFLSPLLPLFFLSLVFPPIPFLSFPSEVPSHLIAARD